jgi:hypothetical protein
MAIKFCIEKFKKDKAYPNLASFNAIPHQNSWRQFSTNSPYSEPVMLLEYLTNSGADYDIVSIDEADNDTFYPIALSFFDFSIDWFSLMSIELVTKLKDRSIKILFYYSEGDNPHTLNKHITEQCKKHKIPREQVKFISANSEARNIDHFYHIVDDELLFQHRNSAMPPVKFLPHVKQKKFVALVRMHKYWRANTMATLWKNRLDSEGIFGYGNIIDSGESENDNPIEVNRYMGLKQLTKTFLTCTPFHADELTSEDQNDHTKSVENHFNMAYLNIVLESHMDVDKSNGVFLTEKTFKPIKNAQMFIIFGACGSLELLRELGYKTFDHALNNKYDTIQDTTKRWKTVMDMTTTVLDRSHIELRDMMRNCEDDLVHNQELFITNKKERLNKLIKELHE